MVKENEKVEIIDQKVKAGWLGGVLFLEVHTMHSYGLEEDEPKKPNIRLLPEAAKIIQKASDLATFVCSHLEAVPTKQKTETR